MSTANSSTPTGSALQYLVDTYSTTLAFVVATLYLLLGIVSAVSAWRDRKVALRTYILLAVFTLTRAVTFILRGVLPSAFSIALYATYQTMLAAAFIILFVTLLHILTEALSRLGSVAGSDFSLGTTEMNRIKRAHTIIVMAFVAMGVTAAVKLSDPTTSVDDTNLAKILRKVVTYGLIVLNVGYLAASIYGLTRTVRVEDGQHELVPNQQDAAKESLSTEGSLPLGPNIPKIRRALLFVVLPTSLVLLVRMAYSAAVLDANPYTDAIYREHTWYPLVVLPEMIALFLLNLPIAFGFTHS
ncbi:hypothetical protein M427DRAFT_67020 [Gonapodya prolifera JEL478]|uniref:Uncharacterized protein n=1 Tax=Gonapodya prolifera (strain JEL478) TaxID=1344416 RepID=A0A139ATQ8_GONPJ|nr:hypothetical protein M427DRAFT_67020 [Gonapodya prolifera JEL478]|eukprot:KXS19953.1 hypothetical protein M427DRAFT_67020 [Gonapodya prolifera JEL478]